MKSFLFLRLLARLTLERHRTAVFFLLISVSANAQNLLSNPGAETGDFTGWVTGGSPEGQPVIDPSSDIPVPPNHSREHRFGISVGWGEADCYQYQTVTVRPYYEHRISLWYAKRDGTDEYLSVSWANGAFGAPEEELYNVGGNQPAWTQLTGETLVPRTDTVTVIIHYRHVYATNVASIHVDDLELVELGPVDTPTPGPTSPPTRTATPTYPGGATPTPQPTIPLANADFEGPFVGGVAEGWTGFRVSSGGFWKPNELLGRLGGGIYGCYKGITPPDPSFTCIDEYQTVRMSGKTHGIDMSRDDLCAFFVEKLGPEVMTVGRAGPENFMHVFPDGDTWENNAEEDGRRFADFMHDEYIPAHPFFVPDAFYSLNEPSVNVVSDLAKVCTFDLAFTRRMHELGHRVCAMNNSVGTPSPLDNVLIPEFRQLAAEADYFGYHNYGNWDTGWMCPADAGPWTYRWQTVVQWYTERGWRHPPVVYTESGQYWWVGEKTPQQVANDLVCYEARERLEEFWSLGINYFVTGFWHEPEDPPHNGWNEMNISLFPEIIDACRQANRSHPVDAHGGVYSQEIGGRNEIFDLGLCQQFPTDPGWEYEFQGWFKYEFDEGWPNRSIIRVGWDPTGQTADPAASTVQWSPDLISLGPANPIYDGPWDTDIWYRYRATFLATGSTASIWIRGSEPTGSTSARIYVDDVEIRPLSDPPAAPSMTVR